jgi:hypothetical protein
MLYRKNSRRNTRRNTRRNRRNSRRNNMARRNSRRNNMMGGAGLVNSMPATVNDNSMNGAKEMSLAQGQQFADLHKNQHGGGLLGGPYPGAVTDESLISPDMAASARVAPLNAALNEIRGMKDQEGGRRRRRSSRKGSRKNRKASKKNRKASRKTSRKNRKASRKNRKGSRKNRRNSRRNNMMGGMVLNPASVSAPGLLLSPAQEAKALSGMNAEWKLAENPRAFAPGV